MKDAGSGARAAYGMLRPGFGALLVSASMVCEAVGAPTYLACEYSSHLGSPTAEQLKLVPRSISVDFDAQTVSWNGTTVRATVSQVQIDFSMADYQYTLSRVSGVIRFFSPNGLAAWKVEEGRILRSAILRGAALAEAQAILDKRSQSKAFEHREHTGECTVVNERKF